MIYEATHLANGILGDLKKNSKMPTVWFSLKRSLHCKSEPSDVHNPKTRKHLRSIITRKSRKSGCSRSIETIKDVIHGSKRQSEDLVNCSPRSIGSTEFINPITHQVNFSNSKCELRITSFSGGFQDSGAGDSATFVGTLTPGTPGPGGNPAMQYSNSSFKNSKATTIRKNCSGRGSSLFDGFSNGDSLLSKAREADSNGSVTCHKCGEHFVKWQDLEAHHLLKHAVTELLEGDSSRKIVEIICKSSWLKSESQYGRIEKVLKVHNMHKTLARLEEYREMVKMKASKLTKKHPRCIADGNELLRFYGTTISCSLATNGFSSSICLSEKCGVCRIIRNGFSTQTELKDGIGVFTTSTSDRAFECIENYEEDDDIFTRKALVVCRVIAGRVHRPVENIEEMADQLGFDSLAGKVGLHSNIEELYLLNPNALLPCFIVICKS